jgi:hypothetical protein
MSDLIDRSKLPTICITIPAGHCEESVKHIVEIVAEGFQTMLESAPAVDAVEVVRCKDCRHWDKYTQLPTGSRFCECLCQHHSSEFYCAYGRKTVEND